MIEILKGATFGDDAVLLLTRKQSRRLVQLLRNYRFVALTITATSVAKSTGALVSQQTAGETITAGQVVYLHTDGLVYKTDVNGTAAQKAVLGIALNGGAVNQPIAVQTAGTITIGATVAVGTIYVAGATAAGDINPSADLASGWQTIVLGVADTASTIELNIKKFVGVVP